jgi:membrane fusion protein (multidrug efflux system)
MIGVTAGPAIAQPPPPQAPAVTVVAVARKNITPSVTFTGRVEAIDKVDLRARVNGYLEERRFTEGGEVQASYAAEVAQLKAAVRRSEASLQLAKIDLNRQEELLRKQVVPQAKVDESRAKYEEQLADLQRNQASLEQATINLEYTEIHAPMAGQIGRSRFAVGNYVTPESGTLATIVSRDPMYVTFPVTQRELLAMYRGAVQSGRDPRAVKISIRLADGSAYGHTGAVDFVDVQVDPETDSVAVRAKLPNPERLLIDGQLVTVVVEIATPRAALIVPQQALQFDQRGYFVLTVDDANRVKVRPVGIGPAPEGEVEITTGLQEGERVIVEGIQKVRPDQVVQVSEAKGGTSTQ